METQAHVRSLYRALLRELPTGSLKSPPTPLRISIRNQFAATPQKSSPNWTLGRRQEAEQAIQYLKAQRTYCSLLERYNPGADMSDEERVRLSARRVGMNMPEEWYGTGKKGEWGVKFEKIKKE